MVFFFYKHHKRNNMNNAAITYAGQAGYILESSNGTRIGIDLYLSDCVERENGYKRLMPRIFHAESMDLDFVIATHSHFDHFDIDAIPDLLNNKKTVLVTTFDTKKYVLKLQVDDDRVIYLKKGDCYTAKDILVEAVECDHGIRMPYAVGLLVTIDEKRIYLTGDTAFHPEFADSILQKGHVDYMISPINGAFGNMNEKEAVELCKEIKPQTVIPCHYWCFAEHGGDPGKFVSYLQREMPEQNYLIMALGETRIL